MMTRRSFLTVLCALPLIGKWVPKPRPVITRQDTLWPLTDENWRRAIRAQAKAMADELDRRAAEYAYGLDQWPEDVRAERLKAGRPVL